MKFVALVSGGKDSIYATLQAINNGHELVCCAHLAPPLHQNGSLEEDESYMYQTAGSEAVRMQVEECIGVPLYVREIHGRSKNTSLVYDDGTASLNDIDDDGNSSSDDIVSDEVEDLYVLLKQIQGYHPDISAVSSGAILSTYQRTRIENVCTRLQLTSLSYLWRMSSQTTILNSILDDGNIDAVLVRVACPPGLMPHRHLGKSLRELRDGGVLDQLKDKFHMHPAGEGGEYETLVIDCPRLFKHGKLILEKSEVVCDESDDGVGVLRILKCSVEKKKNNAVEGKHDDNFIRTCSSHATEQVVKAKSDISSNADGGSSATAISTTLSNQIHLSMHLPNVRIMKGGLCHISALLSPIAAPCNTHKIADEAQAAVQEFLSIRQMLHTILSRLFRNDQPETSPQDILYVHLYLSEISHFAKINQHYQQFFGTQLPPSRSCVAVGKGALPGGRRVMMDCILQRGSGGYLRSDSSRNSDDDGVKCDTFLKQALQNKHHSLRKTLHVQSISCWAPVCIGPYSQANALRSSLVFLAGMIGLVPQSMTLIQPSPSTDNVTGWEVQLYQSWKNAAAVLDGLEDGGGRLEDCLGGLVYFSVTALQSLLVNSNNDEQEDKSEDLPWHKLWETAQFICNDVLSNNAGVVMGSVDGVSTEDSPTDADPSLYDEDGLLYGGYEDEETWREISGVTAESASSPCKSDNKSGVPLLMVCLPELPANAEAEVELILASRRAASCLDTFNGSVERFVVQHNDKNASASLLNRGILWDTGYNHDNSWMRDQDSFSCIEISSVSRLVGLGCAGVSTVMARWKSNNNTSTKDLFNFDMQDILSKMIDSAINNAKGKDEMSSLFTIEDILNVRLYYKAASVLQRNTKMDHFNLNWVAIDMVDDGSMLRTQLHSVLQVKSKQYNGNGSSNSIPAYTVVPVLGMHLSDEIETPPEEASIPLIAMQVTFADMIRMETEMWARHNRQYEYDN